MSVIIIIKIIKLIVLSKLKLITFRRLMTRDIWIKNKNTDDWVVIMEIRRNINYRILGGKWMSLFTQGIFTTPVTLVARGIEPQIDVEITCCTLLLWVTKLSYYILYMWYFCFPRGLVGLHDQRFLFCTLFWFFIFIQWIREVFWGRELTSL